MPPDFTLKIMIVESYGSVAKALSNHLSGFGTPLQIVTASDAPTAIARMKTEPADLVIIDTFLRGKVDGFELCRSLRASPVGPSLPIILLLGGTLSLERSKGIHAGADLLLHRPVVKEELLRMLQVLLRRNPDRAESAQAAGEEIPLRRLHSVV